MNTFVITNVLLLDDEQLLRDAMAAFLEDEGFNVHGAPDCRAALDLAAREPVDLAVVDISLPGENGDFFIMQAHRQWPGMKFLIHTGSADFSLTKELVSIGMTPEHVLRKPLADLNLLRSAIMNHGLPLQADAGRFPA